LEKLTLNDQKKITTDTSRAIHRTHFARLLTRHSAGAQLTCFTVAKVQIMTPEERHPSTILTHGTHVQRD
jgi:hypothetical protein